MLTQGRFALPCGLGAAWPRLLRALGPVSLCCGWGRLGPTGAVGASTKAVAGGGSASLTLRAAFHKDD